MENESPRLSLARELLDRQESNLESFGRAVLYSGLQNPLNGLAQIVDRSAGTNLLPNLQFVDAPRNDSLAAQLGSLSASVGHCALMIAAGHKIAGPLTDFRSFSQRALVSSGMGALYGGLLNPVASDGDFLQNRLSNSFSGAAAMAGVSAFSSFYRDFLAKGVSFLDAPLYHGVLMPASLAGVALMADTRLLPRDRESLFLPSARLRNAEQFMRR